MRSVAASFAAASLTFAACAHVPPPAVESFDAVYRNWTPTAAAGLAVEITQMFSVVDPGDPGPALPSVRGEGVDAAVFGHDLLFQSEDGRARIRRASYRLDFGTAPPGTTVRLAVDGQAINLAAGIVAAWIDAEGREIDRTRTVSLMDRRALTERPPEGARGLHLEYADTVGGVWMERGGAEARLRHDPGEERPFQVEVLELTRPIHFWVDFASPGLQGPRKGRRWWMNGGRRIGTPMESA